MSLGSKAFFSDTLNPYTKKPFTEKYHQLLEKRVTLPVYEKKADFLRLLNDHQIVIVNGETGSGKTTQIPRWCLENTGKAVICTQPRRTAAMYAAQRVAREMDVQLGDEVGYSIRFEDKYNDATLLKYMTDGMLLRELISGKALNYEVIILDDIHERTLSTDILMGVLKRKTQDFKLVIMTDNLAVGKFQQYFENAPVMEIPKRSHPVEIIYTSEPEDDYLEASVRKALEIITEEKEGDILIFLTDREEVEEACNRIQKKIKILGPEIGELEIVSFQPKFYEGGNRKIVVSTNIAETCSIDGIVFVIDPGFSTKKLYNPRNNSESLLVSPISKASAQRRSQLAGHKKPGKCFRLYSEYAFRKMLDSHPEILRYNLTSAVLQLKKLGIDLMRFDFLDHPSQETLTRSLESLKYLKALNNDGKLTGLGEIMAEFPIDPQLAKMLISSCDHSCSNEVLSIVAMLSVPHCFLRPCKDERNADEAKKKLNHINGDHLTLLNVYNAFKESGENINWCLENYINYKSLKSADLIRKQLEKIMNRLNLKLVSSGLSTQELNIRKAIVQGFFMQAAHLQENGCYKTVRDNEICHLHPSTSFDHKPNWVIYNDLEVTSEIFIRTVTDVNPDWLHYIAPHYYRFMGF